MTELSPAAQAVLDAVASSLEGGWISPEFVPYESRKIAAALEALADQDETLYDENEELMPAVRAVRTDQILAIVAELREASNG